LFFSLLVQLFYQLSLIFYNTLLRQISTAKTRGLVAGLGEAFGNGGWLVATAVLLTFSTGKWHLIGPSGRTQVLLPAFIFLVIFTLPLLLIFREKRETRVLSQSAKKHLNLLSVLSDTLAGIKNLFRHNKNAAWFLVGFCFISDAVQTIQQYFAIVMDKLYHISDSEKFKILALMYIFNVFGAYLLGRLADRYGTKKILVISCIILILIFLIAFVSSAVYVLYLLALFAGIGWGGFYVASRALLIKVSPPTQLGEYFGFYTAFQRFASITGPLIWGLLVLGLREVGDGKYRVAGLVMVLMMVVGIAFLRQVKEQKQLIT
jgi:UMF1 family MFS transporter